MKIERGYNASEAQAKAEIDAGLRSYMLSVYNYMGLGVALSGFIAWFTSNSPALLGIFYSGSLVPIILLIGAFILGMASPRLILSGNINMAHAAYWSYAALWGLLLTPYLLIYTEASVVRAFFITAATFFGTSLFGYITKRDLAPIGRFMSMAVIGLIIAMVVNIFMKSSGMETLISVAGVLLFAGLTAYETQEIKNSYNAGDSAGVEKGKAIFGAFLLYGKFIVLFMFIIRLLGQRR